MKFSNLIQMPRKNEVLYVANLKLFQMTDLTCTQRFRETF